MTKRNKIAACTQVIGIILITFAIVGGLVTLPMLIAKLLNLVVTQLLWILLAFILMFVLGKYLYNYYDNKN